MNSDQNELENLGIETNPKEYVKNSYIKPTINYVIKRNGQREPIDINKIKERLEIIAVGLNLKYINIPLIVDKVSQGMYECITTVDIDHLASETCAYMNIIHPEYSLLAARIAIDNLHKETKSSFVETIKELYHSTDKVGRHTPLISDDVYEIILQNAEDIEKQINYELDFTYDFFGFKTLEKSYLLRANGRVIERPQHLLMRVAIGIHKNDLKSAFQTYHLMSEKWFIHATPTLFNSGTPFPQMSSCFLLTMKEDSIDGIYETLKQCALISKTSGGIGLAIQDIRARDSYVRSTNGISNGIIPMLRVFDNTVRYADQGPCKRKGSFAIYLEPWHADIFEFLELKKSHGKEEQRARNLFYALWIPDLFMERTEKDEEWTLMCPNECPGLSNVWGEEFNKLYIKYESENRGRKTVKARKLWDEIIESQIETGTPYMLYKDSSNHKSNQKHLGTIKSSNLCAEIIEYTSSDEIAVCNLASISLPKFVDRQTKKFNYEKLYEIAYLITINLNKIIDLNYYPTPEAKKSNLMHRPIGIGIQGLADAFLMMRLPFESQQAFDVNEKIIETIYFASMTASKDLAKIYGPYESFKGSPASQGILQFDLWDYVPHNGYDWITLKSEVKMHGLRNSLLVALMPTASTSQILGNSESFEPYTSNLFIRRVLAGEFICINPHLVNDLIELNLWTPEIKNKLIADNGSIQNISQIPKYLKELYKTIWEIPQKTLIDLAVSRAPFVDQSQSLTIYFAEPNYSKMCSMHFYGWKKGLKTGMYYLRTRPAAEAIKFTVDVEMLLKDAGQIELHNNSVRNIVEEPNNKNGLLPGVRIRRNNSLRNNHHNHNHHDNDLNDELQKTENGDDDAEQKAI